nr:cytochrome c biogenesis FN, mitochondrial [Tanacetum cinerariifolium]
MMNGIESLHLPPMRKDDAEKNGRLFRSAGCVGSHRTSKLFTLKFKNVGAKGYPALLLRNNRSLLMLLRRHFAFSLLWTGALVDTGREQEKRVVHNGKKETTTSLFYWIVGANTVVSDQDQEPIRILILTCRWRWAARGQHGPWRGGRGGAPFHVGFFTGNENADPADMGTVEQHQNISRREWHELRSSREWISVENHFASLCKAKQRGLKASRWCQDGVLNKVLLLPSLTSKGKGVKLNASLVHSERISALAEVEKGVKDGSSSSSVLLAASSQLSSKRWFAYANVRISSTMSMESSTRNHFFDILEKIKQFKFHTLKPH